MSHVPVLAAGARLRRTPNADPMDRPNMTREQPSQMQRSADAIVRAFAGELGKLTPAERREFLMQSIEWMRARVAEFDEAARRAPPSTAPAVNAATVALPFGKGSRSSDTLA